MTKSDINDLLTKLDWEIDKFLFGTTVDNYYSNKLMEIQRQINELRKFNKNKKGEIK